MSAPALPLTKTIRVRIVGFRLTFEVRLPPRCLCRRAQHRRPSRRVLQARRLVEPLEGVSHLHRYTDAHGNVVWRMLALPGLHRQPRRDRRRARIAESRSCRTCPKPPVKAPARRHAADLLPVAADVDSDLLAAEAWERFGHLQGGWAQVQAISDHLYGSCIYGYGSDSPPPPRSRPTLLARRSAATLPTWAWRFAGHSTFLPATSARLPG